MTRAACALLLLLQACVHLTWHAQHAEEPIPEGAVAALEPGVDGLARCLELLGAPHYVWEYRGEGAALAWVALDSGGLTFSISYTWERFATTSFRYDQGDEDLPGVVLWFGPDLVLERWRRGRMRDLTSGLEHRPAEPDEDG
jgi:hypothetical protein